MTFLSVAKSGTLSLNEQMKTAEASGQTVYKFGFGESPFLPPKHVREALQSASYRKDYTPVAGLPELREKIAEFHSEVDGYPIDASQVLVAPGTKPLLYNIMQAFVDANVFLPAPSWVSYAPQAQIAGHQVHQIPTHFSDRWRVLPDVLGEIVSANSQDGHPNLMVLNYPGNPDGLTYSRRELEALTAILRKHEIWVLSDEIYALLHHQGQHVSLAGIYPERTMVTTGLSKWCGAGGWRLGTLILPRDAPMELYDAMIGLGSETYSCAPAPIQVAGLSAYELDSDLHNFLSDQRQILKVIGQGIHAKLSQIGIQVHPPQGAFYLLLDFSPFIESFQRQGINSDIMMCERLLADTGVALLPGKAFGMPAEAFTARLAYVDFDGALALSDMPSLADANFAYRHSEKMLTGIEILGDWLA